jgi:MarR family 2-MHQ and catechol resistance regulon transcriptional repressor
MNMADDFVPDRDDTTRQALKLFVVLSRAAASVGEHARRDILRHGLSLSEFGVLELLWHKGPQPLGEVAERILLTTGSVTYVIDQLVKQGLVERRACPTDRRVIYAELTDAGRDRIAAIFPSHSERIKLAVAGLSKEEQALAVDLLRKLGRSAKETLHDDPPGESRK